MGAGQAALSRTADGVGTAFSFPLAAAAVELWLPCCSAGRATWPRGDGHSSSKGSRARGCDRGARRCVLTWGSAPPLFLKPAVTESSSPCVGICRVCVDGFVIHLGALT